MPGAHLAAAPGFYGKVPALGDFVGRGLPASFVDPFDAWLRAGLTASRVRLGEAWQDVFLTSPLWSFAFSPGLCGPMAGIGVMIPSVDRVGRYFPFAVVTLVSGEAPPRPLLDGARAWLAEAGKLALTVLGDAFEPRRFEAEILALDAPAPPRAPPVAADAGMAAAPAGSIWSTEGGAGRPATVLAFAGLPPAAAFTMLLDPRVAPGMEPAT
jgi:type VI secretion system protein ImpM